MNKLVKIAIVALFSISIAEETTKSTDYATVRNLLDGIGWKEVEVEKVTEFENSRAVRLDLSNESRVVWVNGDEESGPELRVLNRRKDIGILPNDIWKLTALRNLSLSYNDLREFPEVIVNLTSLETLDLSSNRIYKVPGSIAKLGNLRRLDLSGNRLKFLPECIGEMTSIKELYLGGNSLRKLPTSITNLNLKHLDISNNNLRIYRNNIDKWLRNTCNNNYPSCQYFFDDSLYDG